MFLFIFTSLSEIGLFYYKPKDIFCQHKNNYLRRVAAPGHIASVPLPSFQENKKNNESFHIASIAQRRADVRSRYIRFYSITENSISILSPMKISSQRKIIVIALSATLSHDFETAMEKRTFSAFSTA